MAEPTTREEFKEYCLRKIGKGVLQINVTDAQVEDRIDEALKYYYDYHFDGTEKMYLKHTITANNISTKSIEIPENIIGVINIFDVGTFTNANNMFSYRYQLALNDMYSLTSQGMASYHYAMTNIALIEELLIGKKPIRYNRHTNVLYIDMNWDIVQEGQFFIVEAYQIVDPEVFADVWRDRWLQNYTAQLIKRQWGENVSKFTAMQLPGGMAFDGSRIVAESQTALDKLEEQMIRDFSLPVTDLVG